jgi:histidinol-phosphate aminotransferase
MSRYWSPVVKDLTPYVPGEQPKLAKLIKLNTNENPYGPSPAVLHAIAAENTASLRLYPDPNADALKSTLARHFDVGAAEVFVGNGSDEVLGFVFMALLKHPAPVLFPDITYSFYPVYCRLFGIDAQTIPLDAHFQIQVEDYVRPNGGVIFPNPNAPTGRSLDRCDIERLLKGSPDSVVVIDEAYVDFGAESAIPLVRDYANLLVVQTLSKSRALAGLRLGFAIGQGPLIEALERLKNSFNSYPIDRLALAGAAAAIEDQEWFERNRKAIIESRNRLDRQLRELGFEVLPSAANFLFTRHPECTGAELAAALRERSIVVRHFNLPRIDQFLRITVGTDAQCAALVSALREILA